MFSLFFSQTSMGHFQELMSNMPPLAHIGSACPLAGHLSLPGISSGKCSPVGSGPQWQGTKLLQVTSVPLEDTDYKCSGWRKALRSCPALLHSVCLKWKVQSGCWVLWMEKSGNLPHTLCLCSLNVPLISHGMRPYIYLWRQKANHSCI